MGTISSQLKVQTGSEIAGMALLYNNKNIEGGLSRRIKYKDVEITSASDLSDEVIATPSMFILFRDLYNMVISDWKIEPGSSISVTTSWLEGQVGRLKPAQPTTHQVIEWGPVLEWIKDSIPYLKHKYIPLTETYNTVFSIKGFADFEIITPLTKEEVNIELEILWDEVKGSSGGSLPNSTRAGEISSTRASSGLGDFLKVELIVGAQHEYIIGEQYVGILSWIAVNYALQCAGVITPLTFIDSFGETITALGYDSVTNHYNKAINVPIGSTFNNKVNLVGSLPEDIPFLNSRFPQEGYKYGGVFVFYWDPVIMWMTVAS